MPKNVPAGLLDRQLRRMAVKVVRKDGLSFGLTDFNKTFTFDGVAYAPVTGVSATSVESETGTSGGSLSFRTLEGVEGVVAKAITAEDLRAGLYQDSDVWAYELDPTTPDLATMTAQQAAIIHGRYRIVNAEIKRGDKTINLRETLSLLRTVTGRTVEPRCDARFGDRRCDPSQTLKAANSFSRTLLAIVDRSTLLFSGDSQDDGFYTLGELTWLSGRNAGLTMQILRHEVQGGNVARITLANYLGSVLGGFFPAPGDVATLVFGCDRRFATCGTVANPHEATGNNVPNFQGFKSVPLPDDAGRVGRQAKS